MGLLFNSLGSGLAVATGYELSNSWEAVGELAFSSYPGINTNERGLRPIIASTSSTTKTSLLAELRYHFLPIGSYTPYLSSGLGIAWGTLNDNKEGGWGPLVGFGVRFPFKGFTPFVGLRFHYMYPNSAMDLAGSGSSPDVLTSLGTGLRYTFRTPVPGLGTVVAAIPTATFTKKETVFSVTTDLDPIEYEVAWSFGDGNTAIGHSVRHAYQRSGQFDVEAIITNSKESQRVRMTIDVEDDHTPITIISVSRFPADPKTDQNTLFTPVFRGDNITCKWSFGDGSTSDECEASHAWSQPGTYKVNLIATNPGHSAQFTEVVSIEKDVCDQLPPLATVYFPSDSADLALEMRQILQDNMLQSFECNDRVILVHGVAIDSEDDAESLAENRAKAVVQYYLNAGLSAIRVRVGSYRVVSEAGMEQFPWTQRQVASELVINQ